MIGTIALNAAERIGCQLKPEALEVVTTFAHNGREAVNMIQIAAGIAQAEGKTILEAENMEWVVNNSRLSPRQEKRIPDFPQVGVVNGLAVTAIWERCGNKQRLPTLVKEKGVFYYGDCRRGRDGRHGTDTTPQRDGAGFCRECFYCPAQAAGGRFTGL